MNPQIQDNSVVAGQEDPRDPRTKAYVSGEMG